MSFVYLAWGKADRSRKLLVDQERLEFCITKNVEAAIHHFQEQPQTVITWIDQVCVNQGDKEGKLSHDCIIGDVYTNCSNKIFWLEPPFEHSHEEASFVNRVGKETSDFGLRALLITNWPI
jgi:hypothetical protein